MRRIDRFDKYMRLRGLNDNQVTVQLHLSTGTISKSRKESRDLSDRVVESILNYYSDINPRWLLEGEGNMIMGPYERMELILDKEGMSSRDFAKGASTLSFLFPGIYESAKNNPGDPIAVNDWVTAFVKRFPNYSKDWIMFGTPPMLNNEKAQKNPTDVVVDTQQSERRIPLYDISEDSGSLINFFDIKATQIKTLTVSAMPFVNGAVYVWGDSMHPLIQRGDIVLFKPVETQAIIWGGIYLISYSAYGNDARVLLKYIRKSDKPDYIRLESFNIAYDTQEIKVSAIHSLALVRASITFHTIE